MHLRRRSRTIRLSYKTACDPDTRWEAIDQVLRRTPKLKRLRLNLARLLDEVRGIVDCGLAEQIEAAGNELRAQIIDVVVVWAFCDGLKAGRRDGKLQRSRS